MMNLFLEGASLFLRLQLAVSLAGVFWLACVGLAHWRNRGHSLNPQFCNSMAHILMVSSVLAGIGASLMPNTDWILVTSSGMTHDLVSLAPSIDSGNKPRTALGPSPTYWEQWRPSLTMAGIVGVGLAWFCCFLLLWRERRWMRGIVRRAMILRRFGRCHILLSADVSVPLAFVWQRGAWVVLPDSLADQPELLPIVIAHELQHHRQRDTFWATPWYVLRGILLWNPVVLLWLRCLREVQEWSCDAAVVGRNGVAAKDYARCLLEVARQAGRRRIQLVGATSLTLSRSAQSLSRRIEKMSQGQWTVNRLWTGAMVAGSALCVLVSLGLGRQWQVVSPMSLAEVQELPPSELLAGFPIDVNEEVVAELNQLVRTQEGKRFMRKALERKAEHEAILEAAFQAYGAPKALLAVPLMESGFANLPPRVNPLRAAGMWQFMAQTARNYGLKVEGSEDQRLDVAKSTDAAMRLLTALHLRFKDWRLALLAYNIGENAVQRGMNKLKTQDPWVLARNEFGGDNYLPKVMAGAIALGQGGL